MLVTFSGKPQKVKHRAAGGTNAGRDPALADATTLDGATLPAYATWIVTPTK